jgi:hypothetical protein
MLSLVLALALAQDVRAAATVAPATVEVGQPLQVELVVEHPADTRVELLPELLGDEWVFLGASGAATLPRADGSAATRLTWTVCALEPLDGALPAVVASLDGGPPAALPVEGGAGVTAVGVLAPDEDTARPPRGFRDLPAHEPGVPGWVWLLAAALLALAAVVGFLVVRRRAPPALDVPPTPLERLAAIRSDALEEPQAVQAAYYEITAALRTGVDQRLGRAPAEYVALTDEEWLAITAGELPDAEHELIADLLRGAAQVKYGSVRPTHWGVNETLQRARAALEGALDGARSEVAREVSA